MDNLLWILSSETWMGGIGIDHHRNGSDDGEEDDLATLTLSAQYEGIALVLPPI